MPGERIIFGVKGIFKSRLIQPDHIAAALVFGLSGILPSESSAAEVKIFERGTLAVYANDNWCRFTAHVVVRAPDISVFQGEKPEIHKLADDLRAEFGRTCPKARALWIKGLVNEQRVYDGAVGDLLRDPVLRDRYVAKSLPESRQFGNPRQRENSPDNQGLPERAVAEPGEIDGEWEGRAECGRQAYTVKLRIRRAASGDFEVKLENFGTGAVPTRISQNDFLARFDAAQSTYQFVPRRAGTPFTGRLSADRSALTIETKECTAFDARKMTADMADRAPTTVKQTGGGTYSQTDGLETRCAALLAWTSRVSREYPGLNMMRTPVNQINEKVMVLYADDDFVPAFGQTFDGSDWSALKAIWTDLEFNCRKDPFIKAKGDWVWGHPIFYPLHVNERMVSDQRYATAKHAVETIRRLRHQLKAQIALAYPPVPESYDKIELVEKNAKQDYVALWPSEIADFAAALVQQKQDVAGRIATAWRGEMTGLTTPEEIFTRIPEGLQRNAKFLSAMSEPERETLHRVLADKITGALSVPPAGDTKAQSQALAGSVALNGLLGARTDDGARASRERIAAVLEVYTTTQLAEGDKLEATLAGTPSFLTWRAMFEKDTAPFVEYEPVKRARSAVEQRTVTLGEAVRSEIKAALDNPPSHAAFFPVRDVLTHLSKSSAGESISKALWNEYTGAVDRWMQKQSAAGVSAAGASSDLLGGISKIPDSGTAQSAVFAAANLAEARILSAIYRKDFGAIYKDDPDYVYFYLANLTGSVSQVCPGAVPAETKLAGMKARLGGEVFDPARGGDALQELGGKVLLDLMQRAANPAQWLSDTVKSEEIRQKAENDAIRLAQQTSCDNQQWKPFFDNLTAYFRDPTDGIDPSLLNMTDICRRAYSSDASSSNRYCSCAGPKLDNGLSESQKSYVRADPRQNLNLVQELLPATKTMLMACRV